MSDLILVFANYSEQFIYAGLFLILFLCGLGLPVPEEITLLAGGFLVQLEFIRLYPTVIISFAGVLSGDLVMYSIGRKWGQDILTHRHLRKIFSEERQAKVKQFFQNHGNKTIFIARFISGFRVAAFLAAGTMGTRPGRFMYLDFLGTLVLVPLLLFLGYYFGASISWLSELFTRIDQLLRVLAIAGIAMLAGYFICRKIKSSCR